MKQPLRHLLYKTKFREITKKYFEIKKFPYLPKEVNDEKRLTKLNNILNYAYKISLITMNFLMEVVL